MQGTFRSLMSVCMLAAAAGCGSSGAPRPAYLAEDFRARSPYQLQVGVDPQQACQFGQRVLLSQGYLVDEASTEGLRGSKFFQPESNHQMRLEITFVCLPDKAGAAIYATAVQTRYELKTVSRNTGLSVAGIGSISLPWDEGKESLVKVGEETVADPDFYERLFELLKSYLPVELPEADSAQDSMPASR